MPAASATLTDPSGMRALLHAFPGGREDYQPPRLRFGPEGLEVVAFDRSQGVLGQLHLDAEAFASLPEVTATFGVLQHQLEGIVGNVTKPAYADMEASLTVEADEATVRVVLAFTEGPTLDRRLSVTDPGIDELPQLPDLDVAPSTPDLRATILSEATGAFESAPEVDGVTVELGEGELRFRSAPDPEFASFTDDRIAPDGQAATRLLPTSIRNVAGFPTNMRADDVRHLTIQMVDDGVAAFSYGLERGRMRYYVWPAA